MESSKPKNLLIEERDTLFIESEKKVNKPLKNQLVNSIIVEGINRPENYIQNIYKIAILKTPKSDNKIETINSIFIEPKEKKPLQYQFINEILIEREKKPQNEIMNIDEINLYGNTPKLRDKNIMQQNDMLFIRSKEKDPLIKQNMDCIEVEGLERIDNEIQLIENMEILRIPRRRDMIEEIDSIFIAPKLKAPLEYQSSGQMIIEGIEKPENEIEYIDEINILSNNKLRRKNMNNNIIDYQDDIFIPNKNKEPLQIQYDYILIEGMERPENVKEEVNEIIILRDNNKENHKNNIIESTDCLFIGPKGKDPLQKQVTVYLFIEGIERPQNFIERGDKHDLLRTLRRRNMIQKVNNIKIEPQEKAKERLKRHKVDDFKIEGLINNSKITDKCINFISSDQNINFAIPCSGDSTFAEIEELLYQKYPEYREINKKFMIGGKEILRYKTINDNKIGTGKPIMIVIL